MRITKLSSRDFNQDTSRAKRAAKRGPVFITDRGRLSYVLLTVEEYQRLLEDRRALRIYWRCRQPLKLNLNRPA
jgi:PHD/YefM family antitoxin component YafN of YafNO toxin-antitoxin module